MSLRPTLERERERYRLPANAFDRLVAERERRRRRERVVAIALSAAIAAFAIGAAVSVFRAARTGEPMEHSSVRITPENVGSLRVEWRAALPNRAGTLAIAGDTAFAVTDAEGSPKGPDVELLAFPLRCGGGSRCAPSWTADIRRAGTMPDGPVVADDMVFVGGSDLLAFPVDCRSDGGRCRPSWTGAVRGSAGQPVVDGSTVYVATSTGAVYGFPLSCDRTAAPTCAPTWSSPPIGIPLIASAVANGRLFVSVVADKERPELNRLYAFDTSCVGTCGPAQTADVAGQKFASTPTVAGGLLYVGTAIDGGDGGLVAFDASCGVEPACELWSIHENEALNIPRPLVTDGLVVTAARYGTNAVRAFRAGRDTTRPVWSSCCTFEIADNTPVAANGLVYVSSHVAGVSAYRLACTPNRYGFCPSAWSGNPGGSGAATSAVGEGTLVIATMNGDLVALRPSPRRSTLSAADRHAAAVFYLGLGALLVAAAVRRRRRLRPS
jgi:outer membrane protein assembly factor BamB